MSVIDQFVADTHYGDYPWKNWNVLPLIRFFSSTKFLG